MTSYSNTNGTSCRENVIKKWFLTRRETLTGQIRELHPLKLNSTEVDLTETNYFKFLTSGQKDEE